MNEYERKLEASLKGNNEIMKCIPGDGQVEGGWIDRWLGSFFRSGI